METVNFKISENTGILVMQIAQEHLFENLNPEKAIKTITDSLHGCSEKLALRILKSEYVIEVIEEEGEQLFNVIPYDKNKHSEDFPVINFQDWINKKYDEYREEGRDIYNNLDISINLLREWENTGGYFIDFSVSSIKDLLEGDNTNLINEINDEENIKKLKDCINQSKEFFERVKKLDNVFNFLRENYKLEVPNLIEESSFIWMGMNLLNNISNLDFSSKETSENKVEQHIENQKNIEKEIDKGIEPVNILDNYDAGWIAPDGTYYGLNGDISNLLHYQIADALLSQGVIKIEGNESADQNLLMNGWVKQHKNHIIFEGYMLEYIDKNNINITDNQIKKIAEFGKLCHSGELQLGLQKQIVNAWRFEQMSKAELKRKYFSL